MASHNPELEALRQWLIQQGYKCTKQSTATVDGMFIQGKEKRRQANRFRTSPYMRKLQHTTNKCWGIIIYLVGSTIIIRYIDYPEFQKDIHIEITDPESFPQTEKAIQCPPKS